MGKFVGRNILLNQINQVTQRSNNELKGLKGEIEVGDLLAKYLPDDTYVISQPMLGKYEPDFLVISPRYGFRIIEVKNWSADFIQNVHSNGTFTIRDKKRNSLHQVRKHVEDLKGYLISNHPNLSDPHKQIGYVIIQYGFNKNSMDKFSIKWDERNAKDFFTFHLFRNELNDQIDKDLSLANKFGNNRLDSKVIEEIVEIIVISIDEVPESKIKYTVESEDLVKNDHKFRELKNHSKLFIDKNINNEIIKDYNATTSRGKRTSSKGLIGEELLFITVTFLGLLAICAIILVFIYVNPVKTESSELSYINGAFTYSEVSNAFTSPDNLVVIDAKVESFHFDISSGTKFLKLEAEGFKFNAVIFKDTKTLFINENNYYRFFGTTNEYKGTIELEIDNIEERPYTPTIEQNQLTQLSVTQPIIEDSSNLGQVTKETSEVAISSKKNEYLQKLNNIDQGLVDLDYLYKNGITSEMMEAESERYKRWDDALNEIYGVLKNQLSNDEMNNLRKEQRQWIINRDITAEAESLEFKGGTMESIQYISTQARLTKERCFELVQDLVI